MNYEQAREIKRIIQDVYVAARLHSKDDTINTILYKAAPCKKARKQRKEKAVREAFLEFIEVFPENREVLPCDEPDY